MPKTKIVCTLGPASESKDIIRKFVMAGMNVIRLNFSHGTYEEHGRRIALIKEVEAELEKPIGIMLDTKGPEIRTGLLKEDKQVKLVKDEEITLTTEEIIGDSKRVSVSYKGIVNDIKIGSKILIDDGLIGLEVIDVIDNNIKCKVINGGKLGSRKGVNLPGVSVNLPALTKKDKEDINFGIRNGVHFIAASFVRKAEDVLEIKKLLTKEGAGKINVIAKIENQEGVENIDNIIEVADGIMIARGDLGVEIPPEKVPIIQKSIIIKCNQAAIPVITATQMLDSMIYNPRPTRAEASDVANALFDGTDAIMLSGETAAGSYPVESVVTMAKIAEEVENSKSYKKKLLNYKSPTSFSVTEAISLAACETAMNLKTKCIISSTKSGLTARMVSKHRPLIPIIGITYNEHVMHILTLSWGVFPIRVAKSSSTDNMINNSLNAVIKHNFVKEGDLVTITAGVPADMAGTTNLIEVLAIGQKYRSVNKTV